MADENKKGITVKIDADLHAQVKEYIESRGMTMAEFITAACDDLLHPKITEKEEKKICSIPGRQDTTEGAGISRCRKGNCALRNCCGSRKRLCSLSAWKAVFFWRRGPERYFKSNEVSSCCSRAGKSVCRVFPPIYLFRAGVVCNDGNNALIAGYQPDFSKADGNAAETPNMECGPKAETDNQRKGSSARDKTRIA